MRDARDSRQVDGLRWIAAQADGLRDELIALSNLNSGSHNPAGVRAVAERLLPRFTALGATAEWIMLPPLPAETGDGIAQAIGPALRLRQRPDAPLQIFLGGHLDTVFAADHPFQRARFIDDDQLQGPGVADLKGGLLAMWLALAALERDPARERIGWEVLLNPDEEIGSRGSAPLLAEAARRCQFGLVYEPAFSDGALAGARKGSGNFSIEVHGRAAHAGRNPQDGRNAIAAAARLVDAITGLQREGVTINVGQISGGGALNVVPDHCRFAFNVRTALRDDEHWLHAQLDALQTAHTQDGIRCDWRGAFTRPPKPVDAAQQRLMCWAQDCGQSLGLALAFRPTGGCCDGNNLAAHGLPNLDTMGVVGRDIHTANESMRWSSLAERAQLSALLLLRLAHGQWSWS